MNKENDLQNQLLAEHSQYNISSEEESNEANEKGNPFGARIFITFIWIQGIRSDWNILYVPNEQQIYCANGENKSYDALRFRCYVKDKLSTAVIEMNYFTGEMKELRKQVNENQYINSWSEII